MPKHPAQPKPDEPLLAAAVLDLDALDAEANLKPFRAKAGGVEFELPNADHLTSEQIERYDSGTAGRKAVLLELLPDDDGPAAVEALWRLKATTLNAFLRQWLRAGGQVDAGEGQASTGS